MKSITLLGLAMVGCLALGAYRYRNSSTDQGNEMWISAVEHGTVPFHGSSNDYRVYRNVKDFGCIGDGVADDTACINTAISSGARCGNSTILPALIYVPSGRYRVSSPIIIFYYSQLVGNARDPPTIVAAPGFEGMAMMIDSDPSDNTGNQSRFFRQIRNFILDTTPSAAEKTTTGIHLQVAQAASLVNIHFKMPVGSSHQGIWMENGSVGFMSDLKFEGGKYGMWVGNQQFFSLRMSFDRCDTAIYINRWQWSFKSLTISNSRIGIDMGQQGGDDGTRSEVGSVLLLDSIISDTETAVLLNSAPPPSESYTSNTLLLDNVRLVNTPNAVRTAAGETMLSGGTTTIRSFGRHSRYNDTSGNVRFVMADMPTIKKDASLLDGEGKLLEKARPQYETLSANDFASVKAGGARGDGTTDDSDAIQQVINANVNSKVVYFPSGTYIIGKTLKVPSGTRMIGDIWSVLMAGGSAFQDQNKPTPMLQVGEPGQTGSVEISDFMFSTKGAQPGAVLVQWNLKGSSPGAATMHDAHFRVGGFAGSDMQVPPQCPKGQGAVTQCLGAHTLLHITQSGSAYMENVWTWTGNQDLGDHLAQGQISIFAGRGVLVESNPGPVWLYGIQSEHNVFYQYQLDNARNVYMTMIQSETPNWQPGSPAPQPSNPSTQLDDSFSNHRNGRPQCEMSHSIVANRSTNVYLYGAGMYNFFFNYDQTCLDQENCQDNMVNVEGHSIFNIFHVEGNSYFYLFNDNTKPLNITVIM